jgi:hypothetical protein
MKGRRGDHEIGLREGMADLAAFLDHEPPLEHDTLGDREDTPFERRSHLMGEPVVELGAMAGGPFIEPSSKQGPMSWKVECSCRGGFQTRPGATTTPIRSQRGYYAHVIRNEKAFGSHSRLHREQHCAAGR